MHVFAEKLLYHVYIYVQLYCTMSLWLVYLLYLYKNQAQKSITVNDSTLISVIIIIIRQLEH